MWAGNVNKPLWSIKDLWIFPPASFAGGLSAKWLNEDKMVWEVFLFLLCGKDIFTNCFSSESKREVLLAQCCKMKTSKRRLLDSMMLIGC